MKLREEILNIISSGKGTLEIEFELTQLFKKWALEMVGEPKEPEFVGDRHRESMRYEIIQRIEDRTK